MLLLVLPLALEMRFSTSFIVCLVTLLVVLLLSFGCVLLLSFCSPACCCATGGVLRSPSSPSSLLHFFAVPSLFYK